MQLDTAVKNLTNHGFSVRVFKTQQEAISAISQELSGRTIGFGGSVTLQELGLFEKLSANNTVFWHWKQSPAEAREKAKPASAGQNAGGTVSPAGEGAGEEKLEGIWRYVKGFNDWIAGYGSVDSETADKK